MNMMVRIVDGLAICRATIQVARDRLTHFFGFGHMRELRIQHHGRPYRILYAFDPRRVAILLIGGDKTSDDR
jgi:hypothetical protein